MGREERDRKIEAYGAAYAQLVAALGRFPREMWQYRPALGRWTIHEIIVHITDSEANSYVRCRRLLAEPGSMVLGYDETKWARALNYHDQNIDDALQLFQWLRRTSYELIKDAPEAVWSHTVEHSEDGAMTMDDWLDVYERHVREHIEQMEGVYQDWLAR
ncbi:MAG: DinB family protein [Anaerolineales bacterium]|nr:DinB family protein [Anaerolineales bacterium]